MSERLKVGSMFAGVGGICLGFQKAQGQSGQGYEMTWANEIDKHACHTYRLNFAHNLLEGDINLVLSPGDAAAHEVSRYTELHNALFAKGIDVLTAGFPCQAFSIAGERKGFLDDRGNLFFSITRLIRELGSRHHQPRVLLLENVKNLKGHDGGRTFTIIKGELGKLGYMVKEEVLNTMDVTLLPQNRERIYILCFLNPFEADKFTLFERLERMQVRLSDEERAESVKRLLRYGKKADNKYYYTREKYPRYFLSQDEYDSRAEGERNEFRVNLEEQITEFNQFYQVRRGMYVRQNKSNVCPTLTANMGTGGHNVPIIRDNWGIRKITPEEAFLLQGFPVGDEYVLPTSIAGRPFSDGHIYKQAGNAVSVPVVKMIAEALLEAVTQ